MNYLRDIITYVRRIIKSPSNVVITDELIIDYINRFWIMDVDARMQHFDLKTKYQFQTTPGVDQYNMPLYSIQSETPDDPTSQDIGMFPVYQGFVGPCYINGVQVGFQTQKNLFFATYPNVVQYSIQVAIGNGSAGPYTLSLPILNNVTVPLIPPLQGLLRGHIDITGIISTGQNEDPPLISNTEIVNNDTFIQDMPTMNVESKVFFIGTAADGTNIIVQDSGQFLDGNANYGLLMEPGKAPFGNLPLTGGPSPNYSTVQNTINYFTGVATDVYFPAGIPAGSPITAQCLYFQSGLPRQILYYNNTLTLRSPPDKQYLVELDAYLSPAAFFNTEDAIPFGYMAEYIARGAARKILSDTGDIEQFQFYEPLFKEQELLVWKRSQRQWTATRSETIYSQGINYGNNASTSFGGSIF